MSPVQLKENGKQVYFSTTVRTAGVQYTRIGRRDGRLSRPE